MIKINLVPPEILAKEAERQLAVRAGIGAAIALVILVGCSVWHWQRVRRLDAKLVEDKASYDKLQKIVEQVEALQRMSDAVHTRLGVITDLLKGRPLYPYFMSDLAATIPADSWLSGIATTNRGGNQLGVVLSANSNSSEGVTAWMRNLANSGKFDAPTISAINISGSENAKVDVFTLTTNYKSPKL